MFTIINKNKEYITRKSLTDDFSFTDNNNFAYVYDNLNQAEAVRNILEKYQCYNDLEIITI